MFTASTVTASAGHAFLSGRGVRVVSARESGPQRKRYPSTVLAQFEFPPALVVHRSVPDCRDTSSGLGNSAMIIELSLLGVLSRLTGLVLDARQEE